MKKAINFILAVLLLITTGTALSAQCPLVCTTQINVLVPSTGELEITPDMLVIPNPACVNQNLIVRLLDENSNEIASSPFVTTDDQGNLLTYEVSEPGIANNVCWGYIAVWSNGDVNLAIESISEPLGAEVCVPITVSNFHSIVGGQWSVNWDPAALSFKNVQNEKLENIIQDQSNISQGSISFSWLNPNFTMEQLNDGSSLMELCFDATEEIDNSEICITDSPAASFTRIDEAGQSVEVGVITNCGSVDISVCVLPCYQKKAIALNGDETRVLSPRYFLLESRCAYPDATLDITDATGTSLGSNVSATQVGQVLTATVSDVGTNQSCTTQLTVDQCNGAPVNIEITQRFENNLLLADFLVDDAIDMLGFQFTINYDQEVLEYQSLELGDSLNPGATITPSASADTEGHILITQILSNNIDPVTIPAGKKLLSVSFKVLKEESSEISIGSEPLEALFVDANLNDRCIYAPASIIKVSGITGTVYEDKNDDCTANAGDAPIADWIIEIVEQNTGLKSYGFSDVDGSYTLYAVPGTYTATLVTPNNLWSVCENDISVSWVNDEDKTTQDFLAQIETYCPAMTIDVGTNFLRRCFDNTYTVDYCNKGTELAEDAYIEIELDEHFTFVSTAHTDYTLNGSTLVFNLGAVPYGDCGDFSFTINLNCDMTIIGQTHCLDATIFPNEDCVQPRPSWSGANLEIKGNCDNNTVNFIIENSGTGAMAEAQEFIIVEDDVMRPGEPVQLAANVSHAIDPLPANGATYRVMIPQVPDHPNGTVATLALEGCGVNSEGVFSTGFVNMFPESDGNATIDIDCTESRGAFDPNDKAVTPKGYTDKNFISANTELSYHIRFQNTGTDTAFRVIVEDVISENLDLASLELGAASHSYDLTFEGRKMVFTFPNIMLVDSVANEPESHGFLKFKLSQIPDLADGQQIANDANIFFDFNEPILTNLTKVEIGSADQVYTQELKSLDLEVFPNPTADLLNINHSYSDGAVQLIIYDQLGRIVKQHQLQLQNSISVKSLPVGIYEYKLRSDKLLLAIGQFSKI